jgi:hypothetical protein
MATDLDSLLLGRDLEELRRPGEADERFRAQRRFLLVEQASHRSGRDRLGEAGRAQPLLPRATSSRLFPRAGGSTLTRERRQQPPSHRPW